MNCLEKEEEEVVVVVVVGVIDTINIRVGFVSFVSKYFYTAVS